MGLRLAVFVQRLRDALFSKLVSGSFAEFGRGSRVLLPFRTGNADKIAIGEDVLIGFCSWLFVPSRENDGVVIRIGNRVRMNESSISAVLSVVIEDGVEFARGVYVSDHSHSFDLADVPIRDQPIARQAPVRIGAGSWLGQNVVVLPGVTIGRGCVIGANSVVRDDVPDRCVAVGAPARVVRTLDS